MPLLFRAQGRIPQYASTRARAYTYLQSRRNTAARSFHTRNSLCRQFAAKENTSSGEPRARLVAVRRPATRGAGVGSINHPARSMSCDLISFLKGQHRAAAPGVVWWAIVMQNSVPWPRAQMWVMQAYASSSCQRKDAQIVFFKDTETLETRAKFLNILLDIFSAAIGKKRMSRVRPRNFWNVGTIGTSWPWWGGG